MQQPVAAAAWTRQLIDLAYGHPKPWGFVGIAGVVGLIWFLAICFLLGVPLADMGGATKWQLPLVDRLGTVAGTAATVVVVGTLLYTYPVAVWRQWRTRQFYRRMFGSYYSEQ